jgi:hypothetical protein
MSTMSQQSQQSSSQQQAPQQQAPEMAGGGSTDLAAFGPESAAGFQETAGNQWISEQAAAVGGLGAEGGMSSQAGGRDLLCEIIDWWQQEEEEEEEGDGGGVEAEHYAVVTDGNSVVREGPPTFDWTNDTLQVGLKVHVEEIQYKEGKYHGYARVTDAETGDELGWTSEANLTSCNDIDEEWEPDEALDLEDLSDDELKLAELYNEKGGFLETEAERVGITVGQAAATLMAESSGKGFAADGRMIIRFENHRFHSDWGQANPETYAEHFKYNTVDNNGDGTVEVWEDHEWRENAEDEWQDVHQNQGMEYQVFEFASGLGNGADEAAAGSISMGAGQLMGDGHADYGYDSALEMMEDMQANAEKNVGGVFSYIENNEAAKQALDDEDYEAFAAQYNGPGKAAEYGGIIENLVAAWDSLMEKKGPDGGEAGAGEGNEGPAEEDKE